MRYQGLSPLDRRAPRHGLTDGPAARALALAARRLESLLLEPSGARPGAPAAFTLPPELRPDRPAPPRRTGRLRRVLRGAGIALLAGHLVFVAATSLLVACWRFVDPPVTVLMAWRAWGNGWKIQPPRPLELKRVPSWMRSMLIAVEDSKFYEHHGLDFKAIQRAREVNERIGRPLYGGSTLTMQVARTLFLVPEKSYLRKYLELIVTLELELLLPKDRILELYFGYAEWGKGIFGIEAAARYHYGRGLSSLSREEGARLVTILSSPIRFGPETIARSGILRDRFAFLERRFLGSEQPPGGGAESPDPLGAAADQGSGVPVPLAAAGEPEITGVVGAPVELP